MRFELHNPPNRFSLSDILEIQYPPHCSTNLLCNLTCEYGYKLNGNRCPLCECNDKPIENCSFSCGYGLAYMPLNDRLCKCTKHCRFDCNHLFFIFVKGNFFVSCLVFCIIKISMKSHSLSDWLPKSHFNF